MIEGIKIALRISSANLAYDTEIKDLIAAARQDLMLSGVTSEKANDDTDPLIKRVVSTYVKANFGWDNPDSEELQKSYETQKRALGFSVEYSRYTITFTVTDGTNPLEDATVSFNNAVMITNSIGEAKFIGVREQQNMEYSVTLEGYEDTEGTVDVEGSLSISVSMTAVV
jgi:uncharacterized phage protein (predicted DNA packaging)